MFRKYNMKSVAVYLSVYLFISSIICEENAPKFCKHNYVDSIVNAVVNINGGVEKGIYWIARHKWHANYTTQTNTVSQFKLDPSYSYSKFLHN